MKNSNVVFLDETQAKRNEAAKLKEIKELESTIKYHRQAMKEDLDALIEIAEQNTEIIYQFLFRLFFAVSRIKCRKEAEQKISELENGGAAP